MAAEVEGDGMALEYDDESAPEYRAGDLGVRFWLRDSEDRLDLALRIAVVIGNPALQRLGGDGDRDHMVATFLAHRERIVAGALRVAARTGAPAVPAALRLSFEDLPPA